MQECRDDYPLLYPPLTTVPPPLSPRGESQVLVLKTRAVALLLAGLAVGVVGGVGGSVVMGVGVGGCGWGGIRV